MFAVWCCCEGEARDAGRAERSSAAGLSSEAVTHFMQLNTEQTGWRQTLQHAAGYERHSQLNRKGGVEWGGSVWGVGASVRHNSISIILA